MLNLGSRAPQTTILSALANERPLSKLQSETGSFLRVTSHLRKVHPLFTILEILCS